MIQGGMSSVSVNHTSRLEPGLLQAGRCRGPSLRLALKQQADKVPGGWAHTLEVVLREAEVQATDVQTCLLQTLIQEGRGATQYNVGHHPCKLFMQSIHQQMNQQIGLSVSYRQDGMWAELSHRL